jgi:hypothetical protein
MQSFQKNIREVTMCSCTPTSECPRCRADRLRLADGDDERADHLSEKYERDRRRPEDHR